MEIKWNYAHIIEPSDLNYTHIRMGLREDGVVVWEQVKYNKETQRWEPDTKK